MKQMMVSPKKYNFIYKRHFRRKEEKTKYGETSYKLEIR